MNRYEHLPEYEDALNRYLDGEANQANQMDSDDVILAAELMSMARSAKVDPDFEANLSLRLAEAATARRRTAAKKDPERNTMFKRLVFSLAGAALLVVSALFALPAIINHQSQGNPPALAQNTPGAPVASAPSTQPNLLAELPFLPRIASASSPESGGIFGDSKWTLDTSLPDGPARSMVYRQVPEIKLDPATARETAAKLGLQGEVYSPGGNSEQMPMLDVIDGATRLTLTDSPNDINLVPDHGQVLNQHGAPLPLEKSATALAEFLKAKGLLSFPYRGEADLMEAATPRLVRLIDGYPLEEFNPFNPWIWGRVTSQGQVDQAIIRSFETTPVGEYPLTPASQAWDDLINARLKGRVIYTTLPPAGAIPDQQTWMPTYTAGQKVDLYGFPEIIPAAECCSAPAMFVNYTRVLGDTGPIAAAYQIDTPTTDAAAQATPTPLPQAGAFASIGAIHVWGTMETAAGGLALHMEGWEPSSLSEEHFEGQIKNQPGGASLTAKDGRQFSLANPPADLPEETPLNFDGIILKSGEFTWTQIKTKQPCFNTMFSYQAPGGSGMGGGGGAICEDPEPTFSAQSEAMLAGNEANTQPQFPPVGPHQPGDEINGETGVLRVEIKQKGDGSRITTYSASFYPEGQIWSAALLGDNLSELDNLYNLNVRFWGVYAVENGSAVIHVQRFEQAYPDEHISVWMGTQQLETLEGRKVIVFKALDGSSYVLNSSFITPEEYLDANITPGEKYFIEGAIVPGQLYGGLPILRETLMGSGLTSLEGYELTSNKPFIAMFDENPQEAMAGEVHVEKAELVYYTPLLAMPGSIPADDPQRFVQPLWKFSGTLADGSRFAVLVQAVSEEYLQ